jgi:2-phospho-L-lactate guanylyltransferase
VIVAIVPAKALDQAKQRLAVLLSESERRQLALAMLEDVITALKAVPRIGAVRVVSPDEEVLSAAERLGATAVLEPETIRGINQALNHARDTLPGGVDGIVVVLADVAAIAPEDIETALDLLPSETGMVICPSHDKGTSLLLVRPPGAVTFRFGRDSFQNHKREAAARGLALEVLRIDSLARDVDEPDDLLALLERPGDSTTRRLLTALGVAERLETVS